jgi:peptidoglycan-N-acetylglucosamine deacetylase
MRLPVAMERRVSFGLASLLSLVLVACGVDSPSLQIDMNNTCANKQALTNDQQAGAKMADKTISLTFDDGPAEATSELSTYLKQEGIKATFFINGANTEGREAVVRQTVSDGHLLGNHTHTHQSLPKLGASEIVDEIVQTDKILTDLVPANALYFRAPFGDWDGKVHDAIAASAMGKYKGPVAWDIGEALTATAAADWDCWDDETKTAKTIKECGDLYMNEIKTKKKGIVLLHDGPPEAHGDKTFEMIKYVVPLLKKEGYRFVRVDEVSLTSGNFPIGEGRRDGPAVDPCR